MSESQTRGEKVRLPEGLVDVMDQVRATILALLASMQEKEREFRRLELADPEGGVAAGMSDIRTLRSWADRTLHTLDTVGRGDTADIRLLLDDLGEFQRILDGRVGGHTEKRRE